MTELTHFTPVSAALGGILIGLAAVGLMAATGRIAGISGILGGLFSKPDGASVWRLAFLIGLMLASLATWRLMPSAFEPREGFPLPLLLIAGLLVGYGTSLGSGCTSGHGVCGLSRLSVRSLLAVMVFMAAGIATASLLRMVLWS